MLTKYMESTFPLNQFNTIINKSEGKSALAVMNEVFGITGWTYQIKQVQHGTKSTFVMTTVYMPGLIRDGQGLGPLGDVDKAIDASIWNILNQLKPMEPVLIQPPVLAPPVQVQTTPSTPPPAPAPAPTAGNPGEKKAMTYEEGIAALMTKFKVNKPQAENLHKVRAKYQIATIQQLLKYLQNWNATIQKVEDLNATNIDAFIEWANNNQPEGFAVNTGVS